MTATLIAFIFTAKQLLDVSIRCLRPSGFRIAQYQLKHVLIPRLGRSHCVKFFALALIPTFLLPIYRAVGDIIPGWVPGAKPLAGSTSTLPNPFNSWLHFPPKRIRQNFEFSRSSVADRKFVSCCMYFCWELLFSAHSMLGFFS
jgi:hypothetical protein